MSISPSQTNSWNPFALDFDPEIYARGKSHFQITFLFVISKSRRQALTDFYAFCRLADDISDQSGLSFSERSRLLDELSDWVLARKSVNHPFWNRFRDERKSYGISDASLLGIIDGVRNDLTSAFHLATWDELNRYCYGVACCVGEGVLAILGAGGPRAAPYALAMGRCLQYLNIMRDLEEDFEIRRVYVPEEFLKGRSLLFCLPEIREELYKRALEFRKQAEPYSWRCLPAEFMAGIYMEGARKYWRAGNPKRLTLSAKLWIIAKTLFKRL